MRLPAQKKIMKEDLKDAPKWIDGIINPLNSFMESVYQTLNKNVTFSDNINSFIKELDYDTISSYPTAQAPITFINTLKFRATGVLVLQAYVKETYTPAPGPVYVPFVEIDGVMKIGTITGLEANTEYMIRLLVI